MYWNLLNNLPQKGVNKVVTPSILKMDKRTCDSLLNGILEEKRKEDYTKKVIQ